MDTIAIEAPVREEEHDMPPVNGTDLFTST
jgi:hypothetical protein